MTEVVRIDPSYILAPEGRTDERSRVLKHDDTFGVFDAHGDLVPGGLGELGLYWRGTRFLSRLELTFGRVRPVLLSSTVRDRNDLFAADLTNPDITTGNVVTLSRGTLHLSRVRLLRGPCLHERLRVTNYGLVPVELSLLVRFEADYADVFEVRGQRRPRRGQELPGRGAEDGATLAYKGLDGVVRRTVLRFDPPPDEARPGEAWFRLRLLPHGTATYGLTVRCEEEPDGSPRPPVLPVGEGFDRASAESGREVEARRRAACTLSSSNERLDDLVQRCTADLAMMTTATPAGPYPYAGVPWYSTEFGRDGIITALECLCFDPEPARGVLSFLAATQADAADPTRDAEPGKILHEARRGEMARLGEIPFGRYYGSVDATPLFVVLSGAFLDRTGDLAFAERLWPHVERALAWIDGPGDRDGDGFVEYHRKTEEGLFNQGWKDSHDAVFHADGRLADPPIALCEVQGYVYAARLAAASMARHLGSDDRARALQEQAEALRARFEEVFWMEDLGTYALALDGDKRPCRVRTSNPGHCLLSGIAAPRRAARVADAFLSEAFFSGWGIRTVAAGESRYNPMSYHNGSVWPHDNAMVVAGAARYGHRGPAQRVLEGLMDASNFIDLHRLPELFCGFHRRTGEGPTSYPVACSPQAWAAGALFLVLQSCLGLSVHAADRRVTLHRPALPPSVRHLRIENLKVNGACVDLELEWRPSDLGVTILRREGDVEVVVTK